MTPVVDVAGPPSAGVGGVADALRAGLPDVDVRERDTGRARVAVLVVSAVAPMTESDCETLVAAAGRADAAVAVVAKIDAHVRWREVLAQNSALLARRIAEVPWFGVAAAPPVGTGDVTAVVAEVRRVLEGGHASSGTVRIQRLTAARAALDRERGVLARAGVELRAGLHRERSGLGLVARQRCTELRTDWRAAAAELSRRGMRRFETRVHAEADAALDDLDRTAAARIEALADDLELSYVPAFGATAVRWSGPSAASRRTERGLTLALGAGFGLGIAVAAGRILQLVPGAEPVASLLGAVIGVVLTGWLVATRELLHDRAVQDRWVCEVAGSLRAYADDLVARRLLDAELHLVAEVARLRGERAGDLSRRIGAADAELRALTARIHIE